MVDWAKKRKLAEKYNKNNKYFIFLDKNVIFVIAAFI
jgi:hypothetical protein